MTDDGSKLSKVAKAREATRGALRMGARANLKRKIADKNAAHDPTGARFERREAEAMAREARERLALSTYSAEPPMVGSGGELVPPRELQPDRPWITETVRDAPDMVNAMASLQRLELATDAGALDLAVDAADSIKAANSFGKMLAHQLAAAHKLAMELAGRAAIHAANSEYAHLGAGIRLQHGIEAGRMAASAARMMAAFQQGLLTLDRLRNGGRQTVVVQHVKVADGGQAVVAGGDLKPGRRRKRDGGRRAES